MKREVQNWLLLAILIVALSAVGIVLAVKNTKDKTTPAAKTQLTPEDEKTTLPSIVPSPSPSASPTATPSPSIPTSDPSAKEYLEQAAAAAQQNDYREAVRILDEAIKKFPDDINLQLTKEYYENEAKRYGQ